MNKHFITFYRIIIIILLALFCNTVSSQINFKNLNTNDGLTSNYINTLYRDKKGFLWIGTNFGLNSFDGYRIRKYYQEPNNKYSLINNYIDYIDEDYNNLLWIKTRGGFVVYDPVNELFIRNIKDVLSSKGIKDFKKLNYIVNSNSYSSYIVNDSLLYIYNFESGVTKQCSSKINFVSTGAYDNKSYLWLLDDKMNLYKIDSTDGSLISVYESGYTVNYGLANMFIDSRGGIWIIIDKSKLYYFNSTLCSWHVLDSKYFSGCPVTSISQIENTIYVGTDHGGIYSNDLNNLDIYDFIKSPDSESLSDNSVTCMCADDDKTLWIGTYKTGVGYTNENFNMFKTLKVSSDDRCNDINCFLEDDLGNLWIGTNENGLFIKDAKTSKLRKLDYNGKNKGTIVSLCKDTKNRIWIGTYLDGLYCYDGNRIIDYRKEKGEIGLSVWSMCIDRNGKLWIGTLNKGLFYFDDKTSTFIKPSDYKILNSTIEHIDKDNFGRLIVCGTYGFFLIDDNGAIIKHIKFTKPEDAVSDKQYINYITQDSNNLYWVCTQSGLAVCDEKFDNYIFLDKEDGIGNLFIYTSLIDDCGNIWVSSSRGIFKISIDKLDKDLEKIEFNVQSFNQENKFQDNIFNPKAGYSVNKGKKLFFGGIKGYNEIEPATLNIHDIKSNLLLTDLFVNNMHIKANDSLEGRVVIDKALMYSKKITLNHDENNIRLNLSSMNILYPSNSVYEYRLRGFDKFWNTIYGDVPYIEYANLPYGEHILDIRLKSEADNDLLQEKSLIIEVLPPIWMTWQAYLFYVLLFVSLVVYIVYNFIRQTKMHYRLEQERTMSKYVEELSNARITFFTNLSHELRTPVSLIISPIENIIAKEPEWSEKNNIHMILRNAKRLLFLVNQLLDFRKMEINEIQFNPLYGDIISFIKDRSVSFQDIAVNKNISFTFNSNVSELYMHFDPAKMEQIIFNLLSNSFKYTYNGGSIKVSAILEKDNSIFNIIVEDSGIGLSEDETKHMFEPFYQADNHKKILSSGTGIGLSIVKSFVELHEGKIYVTSEKGKGTIITLSFSREKYEFKDDNVEQYQNISLTKTTKIQNTPKDKTVLVVDDNDDFRFYMITSLKNDYNVVDAVNGEDALAKIKTFHPDIIVSDIMMPVMDGLELCRIVKDDPQLCHLPFLLLTASESESFKVNAYQFKTNAYLTKPFSLDVLKARIDNLLIEQEHRNVTVSVVNEIPKQSVNVDSNDDKLLNEVIKITEEKMGETDFSINALSKEIGISSVYLNKKISLITGKTTSEYVRYLRMRRAGDLLLKTQKSISEVAYEVGYNIPKYFSKHFKEEFGVLPSEYRKNVK